MSQFQLAVYSALCGCQSSVPSIMRRIMEAVVMSRCPAACRNVEATRKASLKKTNVIIIYFSVSHGDDSSAEII